MRVKKYLSAIFPVILLMGIFVVQNHIYNICFDLSKPTFLGQFLLSSFALGVLLYGPMVLFGLRARYTYSFVVSLFVSAIFFAQYLYHSYSGAYLQASAIKYSEQAIDELPAAMAFVSPILWFFAAGVIVTAILFFFSLKGWSHELILTRRQKFAVGGIILLLSAIGYGFQIADNASRFTNIRSAYQYFHDLNNFVWSPNERVGQVGIINYSVGDMISLALRDTGVNNEDIQFVKSWREKRPDLSDGKYFGIAEGRNLVIIQVESLENAVINQTVEGEEITPNLNRLILSGLYFDNYYAQIGPGNTADAEFTTLNSLYPLYNEVAFVEYANNKYFSLPGLLKENGYNTYVLHGDVSTFWNRANIYPRLGYTHVVSKSDFSVVEKRFPTLSDDDFFSQSAEKMKTFELPFMVTLMTLSSHTPFDIPKEFQTLKFSDNSPFNDTQKDYLQSIHYTDASIGSFINDLKKNDLYDNSLIVIYGDHESFSNIGSALPEAVVENDLRGSRVPLIILTPGTDLYGVRNVPGSHLDLYPTTVAMLGIQPFEDILGQDLLCTKTPVVTLRDVNSRIIRNILTDTLEYKSSEGGLFENGTCFKLPARTSIPVSECKAIYDKEFAATEASDFIVHGNLLPIDK